LKLSQAPVNYRKRICVANSTASSLIFKYLCAAVRVIPLPVFMLVMKPGFLLNRVKGNHSFFILESFIRFSTTAMPWWVLLAGWIAAFPIYQTLRGSFQRHNSIPFLLISSKKSA
jgi:hypothetical protein